jgi:hypothetical protein
MRALIRRLRETLSARSCLNDLLKEHRTVIEDLERELLEARQIAELRRGRLEMVSLSRDHWRHIVAMRGRDTGLADTVVEQSSIIDQLSESIARHWHESGLRFADHVNPTLPWDEFWADRQADARKQAREVLAMPPLDRIVAEWCLSGRKRGEPPAEYINKAPPCRQ